MCMSTQDLGVKGCYMYMQGFIPDCQSFIPDCHGFHTRLSGFYNKLSGFHTRLSRFHTRLSGFHIRLSGFHQIVRVSYQIHCQGFIPRFILHVQQALLRVRGMPTQKSLTPLAELNSGDLKLVIT